MNDLEVGRIRAALHPPLKLQHHARVELHRDHLFHALQELHGQITGTRTDFKDDVGGLEARLVDDGLHDERVLEDVLTFRLVELDA